MDDYRSDTKWLWVLGIVVLVVAVVGLVFAISAKNSSVDEDKVNDQISEELEAAGVAVEGDKAASAKADKLAAADRLQIRRAVRAERKEAEAQINGIAAGNKKLSAQNAELKQDVTRLEDDYSQLFENQESTEAELEALEKKVKRLGG